MKIEIGLTTDQINTQYAPVAVLSALYQVNQVLQPFKMMDQTSRARDFRQTDKLIQVVVSILAGCETLSEVNPKLKGEAALAGLWGWPRFADQSNLSRTLDGLTLKQIAQVRQASTAIWWAHSQTRRHNWHGYLWLDFDLSGLPCSARAQASQKGFFSDKKTLPDAN
jgi:hypothetical protein